MASQLTDGSFEAAQITNPHQTIPGAQAWQPAQPGSGDLSLLARSNSPYLTGLTIPDGTQVNVLQNQGQSFNHVDGDGGTYTLRLSAAQCAGNTAQQDFTINVNGVNLATYTPTGPGFSPYTSGPFALPAGSFVALLGRNTAGGTNAVAIDKVELVPYNASSLAPGTLTAGTAASTSVPLALAGTTGGNAPYLIQYQQAPDNAGSPGTWANVGTAGTATSCTPTGLTPATAYWFRAIVADASSTPVTATTAAITKTTAALVLPSIGTITIASGSGNDVISYPPPVVGTYPIASIRLYTGTTAGGETSSAMGNNSPTDPRSFTIASAGLFCVVKVFDTAGNASVASNEVIGDAAPTGGITLVQMQVLLNSLATVLVANISTLIDTKFAARDAIPVDQSAFNLLGTGLAASPDYLAMESARVLVALDTPQSGTPTAGSTRAAIAATSAKVAALNNAPTADTITAAMTTSFGPIKAAMDYLTGYYDDKSVPGWVLVYSRAGVESFRFPSTGRTRLVLPGNVNVGPSA